MYSIQKKSHGCDVNRTSTLLHLVANVPKTNKRRILFRRLLWLRGSIQRGIKLSTKINWRLLLQLKRYLLRHGRVGNSTEFTHLRKLHKSCLIGFTWHRLHKGRGELNLRSHVPIGRWQAGVFYVRRHRCIPPPVIVTKVNEGDKISCLEWTKLSSSTPVNLGRIIDSLNIMQFHTIIIVLMHTRTIHKQAIHILRLSIQNSFRANSWQLRQCINPPLDICVRSPYGYTLLMVDSIDHEFPDVIAVQCLFASRKQSCRVLR
mmetsp:Transcript_1068/g.1535  ORF Transcript_1068/g.1535 Transcript_1068/m.1535 type:complete len:261 (-) Transcript_1068:929-1711(-)